MTKEDSGSRRLEKNRIRLARNTKVSSVLKIQKRE